MSISDLQPGTCPQLTMSVPGPKNGLGKLRPVYMHTHVCYHMSKTLLSSHFHKSC